MQKKTRKTSILFDLALYRVLKIKAVETSRSISDLVNDAAAAAHGGDASDLESFAQRENEPVLSLQEFRRRCSAMRK